MPVISMFYGIIIRMFFYDNIEHKLLPIHLEYAAYNAVVSIPDANLLAGRFPKDKLKLEVAWVEIHKEDLLADWKLAVEGNSVFKIEGLK